MDDEYTRETHLRDPRLAAALRDVRIVVLTIPGDPNILGLAGMTLGMMYGSKLVVERMPDDNAEPVPHVFAQIVHSYN